MTRTLRAGTAAALALMAFCAPLQAQKMYRCGNTYQDRPCENDASGTAMRGLGGGAGSSPAPATATAKPVDAQCQQRGVNTQKIMWAREAGKTADAQSSAAASAEERQLVADVYRRRGSSVEVRAAVEADCMAEKERAAQAAALIQAAERLQGRSPAQTSAPQPKPGTPAQPTHASAAEKAAAERSAARTAELKQSRCAGLLSRREILRRQQQHGGTAAHMENLNRQQREVDQALSEGGC